MWENSVTCQVGYLNLHLHRKTSFLKLKPLKILSMSVWDTSRLLLINTPNSSSLTLCHTSVCLGFQDAMWKRYEPFFSPKKEALNMCAQIKHYEQGCSD